MRKDDKKLEYRDLKPLVKEKFKKYLDEKFAREGLALPSEYDGRFAFGAYMEPGKTDKFRFDLMVPGQRPEDAILILEADVSRIDGTVTNWRCYDEAFVKSV